ncbi:MAG: radical SAM protein, partial [Bacteroidetes bacterium]|nr:radical SAM protein [Bacteroidota bacterium]
MNIVKHDKLKFRYDKFGALAWFPKREIYHLRNEEAALLDLLELPRKLQDIQGFLFEEQVITIVEKLLKEGLLVTTERESTEIPDDNYEILLQKIENANRQTINKPFWAHIQPFKFCNQECIHCYCNGSIHQQKFVLPIDKWKWIIDQIDLFGVLDIYITGGENLIVDDYFTLTEYVIQKGVGTGLSTNAMSVNQRILNKLKRLNIDVIQVSIDGSVPEIHDRIRGKAGALSKSLLGIKKLQNIVNTIIVNMVVNKLNILDISNVIKLGISLGIKKFKVFPQKSAGRGIQFLLNTSDLDVISSTCRELVDKYDVEIECLGDEDKCGSGSVGFAINELGNIFPCIFGVENVNLILGNMLRDNIEDIWFNSEKLNYFRGLSEMHPCTRCEVLTCK